MSEWTKPRTCVACGSSYTLESHGSGEARSTATALESGLDPSSMPAVISRCPGCMNTKQMSEHEAVAAALAIGMEADGEALENYRVYMRWAGVCMALLGLSGFVMALAYAQLKGGEFNPSVLMGLCVAGLVAGIGLFAYSKLSEGKGKLL